jgi:hypothetical protein
MTDGRSQILTYGARKIAYQLCVMPRKRLRIVVTPDMSVRVYAPDAFSEEEILGAIQSKAPWIARHLDAMKDFHPLPTPPPASAQSPPPHPPTRNWTALPILKYGIRPLMRQL